MYSSFYKSVSTLRCTSTHMSFFDTSSTFHRTDIAHTKEVYTKTRELNRTSLPHFVGWSLLPYSCFMVITLLLQVLEYCKYPEFQGEIQKRHRFCLSTS